MAAVASSSNLVELIQLLESQRSQHAEIAAQVADTLEQVSSLLGALIGGQSRSMTMPAAPKSVSAPKVARASAAAPKATAPTGNKRGRRNKFATTGEESVLGFIRKHGNPATAEVQAHWSSEGRGASADNSLSKLYKDKKIKREANKMGRGSRYTVA